VEREAARAAAAADSVTRAVVAALGLALAACGGRDPAPAAAPPPLTPALPPPDVAVPAPVADRSYRLLATAESDDQVALIEFRPCCGAHVVRTYGVGLFPSDIEGPHGVVADAAGTAFYVSLAHGRPFGYLQKIDLASGRQLGVIELGMFPATVDIGPAGLFVYVINFNFEDPEMQPSSLSVVEGATLTEIARPATCRMPHGSRLNPQGTRHYSGCMMDDLLVEIDARRFTVLRLLRVAAGREAPVDPATLAAAGDAAHGSHHPPTSNACSPTWAQPSADGTRVYVACNRSNEIVEVDVAAWRVSRRWNTPAAPYNLAVTPDGRLLVATQKGPGTTTIWRLSDAGLLADVPGTRKVASGVVVSADSRYAFVTLEGIGGDPGTVDVIDLRTYAKVAGVEMGKQAGGIALLP
jgi:DNA-binding beta-propeller fold protein YncE